MSEKVALYARVSTDMQAEKQLSISFQIHDMRAWCKELGWEVVQEYKDEGYSGTTIHRPAFLKMIAAAEARDFQRIVVHNVSRFGRSKADAALKEALQRSSGTQFAYYLERITGDEDNIAVDLYELISRDTVNKLKALSRRGKREAVLRGVYPCAAPYGYVLPSTTSGERGTALIPDKSIAPIVTELFRRYAAGEKKRDIIKWLRESGSPTPAVRSGRPAMGWSHGMWYSGSLEHIITNPAYVGDIVYGKRKMHRTTTGTRVYTERSMDQWLIYRGSHEPLTDRATFEAAQRRMRRKVKYKDPSPVKIFTTAGLGRCATCGGPILFKNKNVSLLSWRFYCGYRTKRGEVACAGSITLGRLREHMHGYLERLIGQREGVIKAVQDFNDRTRNAGTPLAHAQEMLARLQAEESELTSSRGLVIEEGTAARLRGIRRKRAACEAHISALQLQTTQYERIDPEVRG